MKAFLIAAAVTLAVPALALAQTTDTTNGGTSGTTKEMSTGTSGTGTTPGVSTPVGGGGMDKTGNAMPASGNTGQTGSAAGTDSGGASK